MGREGTRETSNFCSDCRKKDRIVQFGVLFLQTKFEFYGTIFECYLKSIDVLRSNLKKILPMIIFDGLNYRMID